MFADLVNPRALPVGFCWQVSLDLLGRILEGSLAEALVSQDAHICRKSSLLPICSSNFSFRERNLRISFVLSPGAGVPAGQRW